MHAIIPAIEVYEEDLQKHTFTFTIPQNDISGFRLASNRERNLLRTATAGGQRYMKMYRHYMEKALADMAPVSQGNVRQRNELNYTLESYQRALDEFNWNWAHTCDANAFKEGKNKMQELKSVALQKKGPFWDAWIDRLKTFQKNTCSVQFA